jgi:hypothetical protein
MTIHGLLKTKPIANLKPKKKKALCIGLTCLTHRFNYTVLTYYFSERIFKVEAITSDYELNNYCKMLAKSIINDYDLTETDIYDAVSETVDGNENVIYYYKAHSICQNCNVDEGRSFFKECYGDYGVALDYDDIATKIVYGEMVNRVQTALDKLIDEVEA